VLINVITDSGPVHYSDLWPGFFKLDKFVMQHGVDIGVQILD